MQYSPLHRSLPLCCKLLYKLTSQPFAPVWRYTASAYDSPARLGSRRTLQLRKHTIPHPPNAGHIIPLRCTAAHVLKRSDSQNLLKAASGTGFIGFSAFETTSKPFPEEYPHGTIEHSRGGVNTAAASGGKGRRKPDDGGFSDGQGQVMRLKKSACRGWENS